ncbi:DUF4166 domain-containing protein [uncultured Tateyamaria sp.]|uniref:DUF4166 domain-containing protein n=1 Tax=uncultured Tateyamaria sp. TaxID=455651 RepID=UPI002629BB90|nr:DUF4166 domain-containing protein [uncultured Tateyamaria sp.]
MQQFHGTSGPILWSVYADVKRGTGALSRLIGWIFRFPRPRQAGPETVSIDRTQSAQGTPIEMWTRTFAGKSMTSILSSQNGGLIFERFTPFTFGLRHEQGAKGIQMHLENWHIGTLPLPGILAPRSQTKAHDNDDRRYQFDVRLSDPLVGLLVHYRGWLEPENKGSRSIADPGHPLWILSPQPAWQACAAQAQCTGTARSGMPTRRPFTWAISKAVFAVPILRSGPFPVDRLQHSETKLRTFSDFIVCYLCSHFRPCPVDSGS